MYCGSRVARSPSRKRAAPTILYHTEYLMASSPRTVATRCSPHPRCETRRIATEVNSAAHARAEKGEAPSRGEGPRARRPLGGSPSRFESVLWTSGSKTALSPTPIPTPGRSARQERQAARIQLCELTQNHQAGLARRRRQPSGLERAGLRPREAALAGGFHAGPVAALNLEHTFISGRQEPGSKRNAVVNLANDARLPARSARNPILNRH